MVPDVGTVAPAPVNVADGDEDEEATRGTEGTLDELALTVLGDGVFEGTRVGASEGLVSTVTEMIFEGEVGSSEALLVTVGATTGVWVSGAGAGVGGEVGTSGWLSGASVATGC